MRKDGICIKMHNQKYAIMIQLLLFLLKDNPSFNEIWVGALVAETYPWADRPGHPIKYKKWF